MLLLEVLSSQGKLDQSLFCAGGSSVSEANDA
jgi:hypothetical protein